MKTSKLLPLLLLALTLPLLGGLASSGTESIDLTFIKGRIACRGGQFKSPDSKQKGPHNYEVHYVNFDDLTGADVAFLSGIPGPLLLDLRLSRLNPGVICAVSQLPNLTDLDLSSTMVTDDDLPILAAAPCLQNLALNYTTVTATGLECFRRPSQAPGMSLGLSGTQIRLCDLAVLQTLSLRGLHLSDTAANDGWLPYLPQNLERLALARTSVTDEGLETFLANQRSLTWLDLSQNQISDKGVKPIAKLPNLQTLLLGDPRSNRPDSEAITDDGLADLTKAANSLAQLDISGAAISDGQLGAFLSKRGCTITDLRLERTPLTGNLEWNAPNLVNLDMSETLVNAHGLSKIAKLTSLKNLWLQSTDLTNSTLAKGLAAEDPRFRPKLYLDGTKVTKAGVLSLHTKPAYVFVDPLNLTAPPKPVPFPFSFQHSELNFK